MFFFIVFMLCPSTFKSSAQARSWFVPFKFSPNWFSCSFLMVYFEAK
jgi:hypothetical protein